MRKFRVEFEKHKENELSYWLFDADDIYYTPSEYLTDEEELLVKNIIENLCHTALVLYQAWISCLDKNYKHFERYVRILQETVSKEIKPTGAYITEFYERSVAIDYLDFEINEKTLDVTITTITVPSESYGSDKEMPFRWTCYLEYPRFLFPMHT